MPEYSPSQKIIDQSLEELKYVMQWVRQREENKENPVTIIKGNVSAAVPTRSLLLLFKLKASWDRAYRIEKEQSDDPEWERGKRIKDYADILALLDPAYGGTDIDIAFLGEQFVHFEFLKACLAKRFDYNGFHTDTIALRFGISPFIVLKNP